MNSNDLISRQAVIESFRYDDDGTPWSMDDIVYRLEQFPSARPDHLPDATKMVGEHRKHGKWIVRWVNISHTIGDMVCSECYTKMLLTFPRYCPNCGADMRGEQNG